MFSGDHKLCSPFFISPADMEASRSEIRRKMMMIGIFRMSIEQGSSVVNQVPTAYAANPTLHNKEMKVKFVSERG